jgi:hypothetical protein
MRVRFSEFSEVHELPPKSAQFVEPYKAPKRDFDARTDWLGEINVKPKQKEVADYSLHKLALDKLKTSSLKLAELFLEKPNTEHLQKRIAARRPVAGTYVLMGAGIILVGIVAFGILRRRGGTRIAPK